MQMISILLMKENMRTRGDRVGRKRKRERGKERKREREKERKN